MFSITYTFAARPIVHRSKSATDALEDIDMVTKGGGAVLKVVETATGEELSMVEIQMRARREGSVDPRPKDSLT